MSEEKTTPQGKEGESNHETVDLEKFVPVAEFLSVKKKLENFEKSETERKSKEMTAEQRALEYEKENAALKESLQGIQAKFKAQEEATREKLLAKLPEDRRARVEGWPVSAVETYVSDFIELSGKGIPGAKPGSSAVGDHGGFGSYSEWAQKDPEGYAKHRQEEERQTITWGHAVEPEW